jgi:predicted MarR family transcription regulator
MALAGALCLTVHAVAGFNNRSLRALVAGLLGSTYTSAQMTYDLRRLRLHGLIARFPRSNTYLLTPQGIRVALFYTKVHNRLLTPLLAADKPPAPLPLRRALHMIDQTVDSYIDHARIRRAA